MIIFGVLAGVFGIVVAVLSFGRRKSDREILLLPEYKIYGKFTDNDISIDYVDFYLIDI